jgi:hypothetical protein
MNTCGDLTDTGPRFRRKCPACRSRLTRQAFGIGQTVVSQLLAGPRNGPGRSPGAARVTWRASPSPAGHRTSSRVSRRLENAPSEGRGGVYCVIVRSIRMIELISQSAALFSLRLSSSERRSGFQFRKAGPGTSLRSRPTQQTAKTDSASGNGLKARSLIRYVVSPMTPRDLESLPSLGRGLAREHFASS